MRSAILRSRLFLDRRRSTRPSGADQLPPTMEADMLIADKAFDADARVLEPLAAAGKNAVIPPRANRSSLRDYDRQLYGERHLIGNFFAKIKQFRAIATRYEKTARNFLAAVHLVASVIWLNSTTRPQSPSGTPSGNCRELCSKRRMRAASPTMRNATIWGVRVMTNSRVPSMRPGRSLLGSRPSSLTQSLIRVPTGPRRVDCLPRWCRRARCSPLAPTGTIRASGAAKQHRRD